MSKGTSRVPSSYRARGGRLRPGFFEHIHPEDLPRVRGARAEPYEVEHQVLEYRVRRADGSYVSVRDEKRLLPEEQDRPREIVGSLADITGRVLLEAQLRQAQKMARLHSPIHRHVSGFS